MDIYHIWCDLKPETSDIEFCDRVNAYMTHLIEGGKVERFRITRSKLGLSPDNLGEFHITVETRDMAQLDEAFNYVATRAGAVESFHHGVNSMTTNTRFALYRDFPDAVRQTGEEKF